MRKDVSPGPRGLSKRALRDGERGDARFSHRRPVAAPPTQLRWRTRLAAVRADYRRHSRTEILRYRPDLAARRTAFALARDCEPVRCAGKAQQRPLELLKFTAAEGGAGVDSALLGAHSGPLLDSEEESWIAKPRDAGRSRVLRRVVAPAATGDHAEALVAFRRRREFFSIVLGLEPPAETGRLYRKVTSAALPPDAAPPA